MNKKIQTLSSCLKIMLVTSSFLISNLSLRAAIIYTDPVPNSKYINTVNNIIIGFDEAIKSSDLTSLIKITGSLSGDHKGKVILAEDGKKLIFKPDQPYQYNEEVNVMMSNLRTTTVLNNNMSFSFHTQSAQPEFDLDKFRMEEFGPLSIKSMLSPRETNGFPQITVTVSNNPSPGYLFMTNFPYDEKIPYTPYLFILNKNGSTYYSRDVTPTDYVFDFQKQPNGNLTYYDNYGTKHKYYAMNDHYTIIDSFYCGNGYTTDLHELRLLPNGHALLMAYDPQIVNMSLIVPGGYPNATVIGLIIQEIDQNKNVVFQWRSWDHVQITDAVHENLTASRVDYIHGNAIEMDTDGNIMISSRHFSEIMKIDRSTGSIVWRLGGIHNQFTFTNDPIGFSYQHCIRRIPNGNITLYDNGNYHSPPFSRAVEYALNEQTKTATLVWQYRNTPDIFGFAMGSVQRLTNGNTLISWGATNPTMTEVKTNGTKTLELTMPPGIFSYRTFKFDMPLVINSNVIIQGFYDQATGRMNMKDTVALYLRNTIAPYDIVDSARSVIDSVNFKGVFTFYNTVSGNFYISVRHRNGMETWSKEGGENFIAGNVNNYDFTTAASQAYGSNMIQVSASPVRFAIYNGDVNQNDMVSLVDILETTNNASNFVNGYVSTDVNGDRLTNLDDVLFVSNNSNLFVSIVTP
ncbi:MAG: aryl-sulfate sulfotransferase [Ignavibacteria bacterium]